MRFEVKTAFLAALGAVLVASFSTNAMAAEKRCELHDGKKVACPVLSDKDLEAALNSFGSEADSMGAGKGGATYGVAVYDYLTGVGKTTGTADNTDSGYGAKSGKTELWDRKKKAKKAGNVDQKGGKGEEIYTQWTNNWSPTFKKTLVPGADPNAGKQWYYFYCVACHGWQLRGDGPAGLFVDPRPRVLTEGKYMNKKSNLQLFAVIKGGGEAVGLSSSMPVWGNILQDQDIWNVVAWIRANADAKPPKTVGEYLNPKSTFKPIKGDVNALNFKKNAAFAEMQELLEQGGGVPGRAAEGSALSGGGFVRGGLRKKPEEVADKVKKGY